VFSGVSHPSVGSPLQSPQPGAHDDKGNAQLPALQVVGPATCGRLVQSFEHEPHVWTSAGDTQSTGVPHAS
jgi:hypothetical protein